MKQTKRLALSAIMAAISVVLLAIGALTSVGELALAAFCSLIVIFVHAEVGSPYQYLLWITVTLISALLFPTGFGFITYFLIFGLYPILRYYIEKLPLAFAWQVKLAYFNAVLGLLMAFSELVFGVPLFVLDGITLEGDNAELIGKVIVAALYLACNIAFIVYDIFLKVMIRAYFERLRPRFAKFLK